MAPSQPSKFPSIIPTPTRVETKQRTNVEPDLRVIPSKTHQGNFFVVRLQSQAKPKMATKQAVRWEGSERDLKELLKAAVVVLAEHQFRMYGDVWDVRELRMLVVDRYNQLISRFKSILQR